MFLRKSDVTSPAAPKTIRTISNEKLGCYRFISDDNLM